MPILIKREPLYPSVTKPGLYFYDNQVDRFIDDDGNEIPISWESLSGIDFQQINRFKFALGTWTEVTRNNRAIKIYPTNMLDFINLGLAAEPVEPKPTSPPDGFLENTEENALLYEPKPPKESWKLFSGFKSNSSTLGNIGGLFGFGFVSNFDPMFAPVLYNEEYIQKGIEEGGAAPTAGNFSISGEPSPNYAVTVGDNTEALVGHTDGIQLSAAYFGTTTDDRRGGWFKGGFNWTQDPNPYHSFGGVQRTHKIDVGDFPFHNEPILTTAHPEFKLYDPKRGDDGVGTIHWFNEEKGSDLTDTEEKNIGRGYWRVEFGDIQRKESERFTAKASKFFKKIGSFFGDIVKSGEFKLYDNAYFEYEWKPNLDNIPFLNREGAYHIPSFEWKWTGREWIPAETLLAPPQAKQPDNQFIGVPIISDTEPIIDNAYSLQEEPDPTILPLFHDRRIPNFNKTTAPLKLWYAVSFFQQDLNELFVSNMYKYHVLEWGDEEETMSVEDVMLSEFFALYDTDEEGFEREQAKRLIQVISQAKYLTNSNSKLNFSEHVYLTSGVKTIRTVIFRLSGDEKTLYETTLITTQINVGDIGDNLSDFNIFGASDFNVLPVNLNNNELIIGAIDKNSDYVNSIKFIEKGDLYGSKDYLEKNHIEKFLPRVSSSMYGDHIGKLDLSTTRVFTKPYDISYFLNSRSTDILIDETDCVVEITPSNSNRIGIGLENTANSNERGVLVGDYKLLKEPNQELKKDDFMEIPKIDTKIKEQAF